MTHSFIVMLSYHIFSIDQSNKGFKKSDGDRCTYILGSRLLGDEALATSAASLEARVRVSPREHRLPTPLGEVVAGGRGLEKKSSLTYLNLSKLHFETKAPFTVSA